MKLETIQKNHNLNEVHTVDKVGPGGAHHHYTIKEAKNSESKANFHCEIKFQKGPRNEDESIHGVIDSDLLEIVRDRLKSFQNGPFANVYNEEALPHVENALFYMNLRVEERARRNVLGKYKK